MVSNVDRYHNLYSSLDSSGGDYSELLSVLEEYDESRSERDELEQIVRELENADERLQHTFTFVEELEEPVELHTDLSGSKVKEFLQQTLGHLDAVHEVAEEIRPTKISFGIHNTLLEVIEYLQEDVRQMLSIVRNVEN